MEADSIFRMRLLAAYNSIRDLRLAKPFSVSSELDEISKTWKGYKMLKDFLTTLGFHKINLQSGSNDLLDEPYTHISKYLIFNLNAMSQLCSIS